MSEFEHNIEVELEVSDPWEFGTAHGTGPFHGRIIKVFLSEVYSGGKLAVLKLDTSLNYKTIRYEFLLIQARHTDTSVVDIEDGGKVLCNLSVISARSANATDPMIASRDDPHAPGLVGSIVYRKDA